MPDAYLGYSILQNIWDHPNTRLTPLHRRRKGEGKFQNIGVRGGGGGGVGGGGGSFSQTVN